jgi:hypothetical protein
MAHIILANVFDPKAVTFSALEKNKKGGKVIFIGIPDASGQRQRITLQTPPLALPFGVSPYTEASTGEVQSYSLDVSYRGADASPKVAEFLAKMRELDDVLLDVAVENSKEWFGKKMSKEILSEFYRKLVKDSATPGQYPPVTKFKVRGVCVKRTRHDVCVRVLDTTPTMPTTRARRSSSRTACPPPSSSTRSASSAASSTWPRAPPCAASWSWTASGS